MRFTIIFWLLIAAGTISAQQDPVKVYPLSREIHPLSYYQEQAKNWQARTQAQPQAVEAWVNFYTAARNLRTLGTPDYELDGIIAQATEAIPNTFELHYLRFWHSNLSKMDFSELFRAQALDPDRPEITHDFALYYELMGDEVLFKAYCQKLHQEAWYSPGILEWNYNALQSTSRNAVLLTHGDNDTFPAWVLQAAKGIRPDVRILNIYLLLLHADYRQRVFAELDLAIPFERDETAALTAQKAALINHLLVHLERPFYLGIGTPAAERRQWGEELYLTGLALFHSTTYFDNLPVLAQNYEGKFRRDNLYQPLYHAADQSIIDYMNMNYVPTLAVLYDYYRQQNRHAQAAEVEALAFDIAARAGKSDEIKAIFSQPLLLPPQETNFDLRAIEKSMEVVEEKLYACVYETSNAWYNAFQEDLRAAEMMEWLAETAVQPVNWRTLLPAEYHSLPDRTIFDTGRPSDDNYPVVNISHAAAERFCEWLTSVYNASDHRRKRWTEVQFFLPTAEQWEKAARGGSAYTTIYPWGGPYHQNAKGCYLGNFNPHHSALEVLAPSVQEAEIAKVMTPKYYAAGDQSPHPAPESYPVESPGEDGAYFTTIVGSYFPNDFEIYNLAGNVAEMLQTPGESKGGGWQDPSYFMQIDVTKAEPQPNPNTGFRIFMQIIQE